MNTAAGNKTIPVWALPVTVLVLALFLGFLGWKTWTGGPDVVGPPREVHAGMYDIRAEVQKMRAAESRSQRPGG